MKKLLFFSMIIVVFSHVSVNSVSANSGALWKIVTDSKFVYNDIRMITESGDVVDKSGTVLFNLDSGSVVATELMPMDTGDVFFGILNPNGLVADQVKKFIATAGTFIQDYMECLYFGFPYMDRRGTGCSSAYKSYWNTYHFDEYSFDDSESVSNVHTSFYIDIFSNTSANARSPKGMIVIDTKGMPDNDVLWYNIECTLWETSDGTEVKFFYNNLRHGGVTWEVKKSKSPSLF